MKKQQILKQLAWLGLISSALLFSSCQSNPIDTLISQTYPETGIISAYGWAGVTFTQHMVHDTVEAAFTISPDNTGEIYWENNTLWFRPSQAFEQATLYQANLNGDLKTTDGQTIAVNLTWDFSMREPELIYYVRKGDLGEIWRCASDGSQSLQLSFTNGNVFDFSPDRSGSWIAFTVQKQSGGQALWIMDRDGEEQQLLVDCGQDNCQESAWAMDQSWIAYTRERFLQETSGYQPAQVWEVEIQSGVTSPLNQDDRIFGHSPSFSPDGTKLAIYDTIQQAIRVVDLQTLQETLIPRTLPGTGDWSSDSSQILFTDEVPAVLEPFIDLYIADVSTGEVTTAYPNPTTDTDFSQPRWSPGGEWIAVSLRPVNGPVNKMLWVTNLNGNRNITITKDQSATFSSYEWDPWGNKLVYQRLGLGSSDAEGSIWIWDWQTRESVMIIGNASSPKWLP